MEERMNGMSVVRIRTLGMPRHIPVLRGIGQFTHALTQLFSGLFLTSGHVDIVLVYSPPLFLGFTALLLRMFRRAKVVVNVQDLFPQSAIDLGLLRHRILIDFFRGAERYLYRHADAVTVHSEGNKEHVVRCGGSATATFVVPNVVDTRAIKPGERNNAFRVRYGLGEKEFVVSFAGVIGYSQDLDTVIDAAKLFTQQRDVVFYIVGDGLEKERLQRRAEGMTNVRFLPMLPKNEYADLLHASDVCLVTLRKEVRTPVVPSKILSIMAAGRPIVASMPLHGDAPAFIQRTECGICVEPEQPERMAEAIRSLYERPERSAQFGTNGRKYVEQHCSVEVFAEQYERLFRTLIEH
jgi:glycosyltransferase involved in cell wall biosynthesis